MWRVCVFARALEAFDFYDCVVHAAVSAAFCYLYVRVMLYVLAVHFEQSIAALTSKSSSPIFCKDLREGLLLICQFPGSQCITVWLAENVAHPSALYRCYR